MPGSNEAATQVNDMIERVANLASQMSTETAGFGAQAIAALDGLTPNFQISTVPDGATAAIDSIRSALENASHALDGEQVDLTPLDIDDSGADSASDQIGNAIDRADNIIDGFHFDESYDAPQTNSDEAVGGVNEALQRANDALNGFQFNTLHTPLVAPVSSVPRLVLPTPPPAPNFGDAASYAANASAITAELEAALHQFFDSFFPDLLTDTKAAVRQLQQLAGHAEVGCQQLIRRMDGDQGGRAYLDSEIRMGSARAHQRMSASSESGDAGTAYMNGRYVSGDRATDYLVSKFDQGEAATRKLIEMFTGGGTSIPAAVENQIWQRERGRIGGETRKQRQTVVDSWAARGYPLPPGGAAMAVMMVESEGQDRIAQSSRERAIKNVDILIENIKFGANLALQDAGSASKSLLDDASGAGRVTIEDARAATQLTIENARDAAKLLVEDSMMAVRTLVETSARAAEPLVKMRSEAIAAASDYMRVRVLGPQLAADLTKTEIEAKSAASRASTDYFTALVSAQTATLNAQVALADLTLKPALANAQNEMTLLVEGNRSQLGLAQARASAATATLNAHVSLADLVLKPELANAQNQMTLKVEANRGQLAVMQAKASATSAGLSAQVSLADILLKPSIANASNDMAVRVEQNRAVLAMAQLKASAATSGLSAYGSLAEISIKPAIANAQSEATLYAEQNRATIAIAQAKAEAAVGAARLVSNIASSALTSLNASVALSQNA